MLVQAAKSDIYVALLGISLAAIIIGVLLMVILLGQYEWKVSVAAAFPLPSPGAVASQLAAVAQAPFHPTC